MPKFMVIQTMAPVALTRKRVKQFEKAIQDSSDVKGHQSFYNVAEGKAMWILEAQDQRSLTEWFQRMEMPYESITPVELEGYHGAIAADAEETEQAEDIFAECDWCNAPIYHGNACVDVTRRIQQADADAITVINAEALLLLCAPCGNRLDEAKLGTALKSLVDAEKEADDIFAECDWCKAPIYHGNASVEVVRHIQQADADAMTVINAEVLLTLCAPCGNRLDEAKLGTALEGLLAAPAAECETN